MIKDEDQTVVLDFPLISINQKTKYANIGNSKLGDAKKCQSL